ncbi:trypsin-like peptidase domain-containing protein [Mycobacterium sp. 236(2023)]|uniref:S1C family serine protease n=1 Tax=Mycobacterium sp. 236(2023) TaxID=3038163 RepID=UPI0024158AC3|nr:trypsin-like peptidase domain-containing protein [Mycobacterium sp. 236(2023)]MDG4667237.1 trypsin-like peptidase domain-containing protein [Mycobacterium sp. 236(2023)]
MRTTSTVGPAVWVPRLLVVTVITLLAACSGATDSGSTDSGSTDSGSATPSATHPMSTAPAVAAGADLPALVRRVEPSVVTVLTESGVGSGIVYRADGTIVTNAHVVDGAQDVTVALADGRRVSGTVRGADEISDVAVIQVDRTGLPAAAFQEPLPHIGELAVVIGSPLGFAATVTSGIISGLHRQIPGSASTGAPLVDLIQTDAAISPGNSGGAVLDAQGEVVGMSVAYIPPTEGAVSLGFAIPAATVVDVADQLLTTGTVRHPFIGIQPATLTPEIARTLGIDRTDGVVAMQVLTPSPAAEAGIQPGDIIIALNGQETAMAEDLIAGLRNTKPGDRVQLSVLRGGETQDIAVTVAERAPS